MPPHRARTRGDDHAHASWDAGREPPAGLPGAALLRVATLPALLYVFLFAIALLGTAFCGLRRRFSAGPHRRHQQPVVGLLIGLLATSLVQSSSGTTPIVVGMVAAGALTVRGAIPIIMGANMGTTITNTIVAMGRWGGARVPARLRRRHDARLLQPADDPAAVPWRWARTTWRAPPPGCRRTWSAPGAWNFEGPVKATTDPPADAAGPAARSLAPARHGGGGADAGRLAGVLLFGALILLTRLMRRVVMARAEGVFNDYLQRNGLLGMLVGLVVTVLVQSSSITTSLLVPLIGAGIVQLEAAFAVTLGANIGTTVTALLASLAGNGAAVTVALVHLLFNLTGTLIFYPLPALRRIPVRLARLLALAACRNRLVALYYVLGVFFAMPLLFIVISKALGGSR
ncbi:MAG: Na/Pi cotransporter family protein [bacterium]|nr:Na/Pi cotransporter family protein [bacterium]